MMATRERTGNALSPQEVDRALLTLYECGGDPYDARDRLYGVLGDRTPTAVRLAQWRVGLYRDRYQELASEVGTQVEDVVLTRLREIATLASEAQVEALRHIRKQIRAGNVTPTQFRELAVVTGISIDKLMKLDGREVPQISINVGDSISRLVELGVLGSNEPRQGGHVDSTAEELVLQGGHIVPPLGLVSESGDTVEGPRARARTRRSKRTGGQASPPGRTPSS